MLQNYCLTCRTPFEGSVTNWALKSLIERFNIANNFDSNSSILNNAKTQESNITANSFQYNLRSQSQLIRNNTDILASSNRRANNSNSLTQSQTNRTGPFESLEPNSTRISSRNPPSTHISSREIQ